MLIWSRPPPPNSIPSPRLSRIWLPSSATRLAVSVEAESAAVGAGDKWPRDFPAGSSATRSCNSRASVHDLVALHLDRPLDHVPDRIVRAILVLIVAVVGDRDADLLAVVHEVIGCDNVLPDDLQAEKADVARFFANGVAAHRHPGGAADAEPMVDGVVFDDDPIAILPDFEAQLSRPFGRIALPYCDECRGPKSRCRRKCRRGRCCRPCCGGPGFASCPTRAGFRRPTPNGGRCCDRVVGNEAVAYAMGVVAVTASKWIPSAPSAPRL